MRKLFMYAKKIICTVLYFVRKYIKRALLQVPIIAKKLGMIYSYSNTKTWFETNGLPNHYFLMFKPEKVQMTLPKTSDSKVWNIFHDKSIDFIEVFLAKLPDGNYISKYNSVVTRDNVLLDDLSFEFGTPKDKKGFEHSVFSMRIPKEKYYDKTIAIIDTDGAYNYYHWIINILPKFYFVERSCIHIDYYVVSSDTPFQKQSLEFMNIPPEKIIPNTKELNIKAKYLLVSSFPGSPFFLNKESLKYLRKKFHLPKTQNNRIFITRRFATNKRNIINEKELIASLRRYGFEVYELASMSFKAQVKLFACAEVILAPHCVGLTNMVFAPDKAKVIEIINPQYKKMCYWYLANFIGLDYYCVRGVPSKDNSSKDIIVDIDKVEETLDLAGIKKLPKIQKTLPLPIIDKLAKFKRTQTLPTMDKSDELF